MSYVTCFLYLLYFDLWTRLRSGKLPPLLSLRRRSDDPTKASPACVTVVSRTCVLYFHPVLCLQRSFVLASLLRRRGIPAAVVIGYRPLPFEAHAWVEVDGATVGDLPSYRTRFGRLTTIGGRA